MVRHLLWRGRQGWWAPWAEHRPPWPPRLPASPPARPSGRFIHDWVYSGVFRDVYGEFMIQVNHEYLGFRGSGGWLWAVWASVPSGGPGQSAGAG